MLLLASAPALAQDDVAEARAQAHVDLATRFFGEGKHEAAVEELQRANALVPLPIYRFNIARCYEEMGKREQALEQFERYVEVADDAARTDRAKAAIKRLVAALYGSVEVSCEPADARVKLEGFEEGTCPHRWERVRPGEYGLTARADKHRPQRRRLKVAAGKVARVAVRLAPLPGQLTVQSVVHSGAVWLDGRRLGKVPVGPLEVPAGPHEVVVRTRGYDDWTLQVVVAPDQGVSVTATPRRATGAIDVRSHPEGAAVLLDGKAAGRTPTTLQEVTPGEHRLALRLDGHRVWEQTVIIVVGKTARVEAPLKVAAGRLRVTSKPAGASVRIDGKESGVTPLALPAVRAGGRRVEVVAEGYRPWVGEARVPDGQEAVVAATLERRPGMLVVHSSPAGATVVVDGKQVGRTPSGRLELPEGKHAVRVTLAAHRLAEQQVVLRAGKESVVDLRLEPQAGTLSVTSEPPGATVLLDGGAAGKTPLDLDVPAGRHDVVLDRAFHASWSGQVLVEDGGKATLHAELPGRLVAWALGAGALLATAGSGLAHGLVIEADDERQARQREYRTVTDPATATALGNEMDEAWERAETAQLTSRILLGVAVGLAGWSAYSFLSSSAQAAEEASATLTSSGLSARWRW